MKLKLHRDFLVPNRKINVITNGYDEEVILVWHYLAHNKKVESSRTNDQLSNLKQETIDLIEEIQSTTQFPPTKSILCDWCEYKSICPAWKD